MSEYDGAQVYAGPFQMTISWSNYEPSVTVRAAADWSIRGEFNGELLIHPHVETDNEDWQQGTMVWKRACLGETAGALFQAAKENNWRLALHAAMNFLTSADHNDGWGFRWEYFPSSLKSQGSGHPLVVWERLEAGGLLIELWQLGEWLIELWGFEGSRHFTRRTVDKLRNRRKSLIELEMMPASNIEMSDLNHDQLIEFKLGLPKNTEFQRYEEEGEEE